ncbi:hypothetical protein RUM44_009630 [Polyplax serrata]|uniref:Uncharacterized protein n=1 Tax=Polyplax serrata TaxID=468196 RepID=A0ABR1ATH5_POLSC
MSPTCASGFHCPPTDDPIYGFAEETTTLPSGLAVVSQDAFYPHELDKSIGKSPTLILVGTEFRKGECSVDESDPSDPLFSSAQ